MMLLNKRNHDINFLARLEALCAVSQQNQTLVAIPLHTCSIGQNGEIAGGWTKMTELKIVTLPGVLHTQMSGHWCLQQTSINQHNNKQHRNKQH
jgi:hypothetical protein